MTTPSPGRGLLMPTRRRTRAAERAKRRQEERELNAAQRAAWARQAAQAQAKAQADQHNKPPPPDTCDWLSQPHPTAGDGDPPPF